VIWLWWKLRILELVMLLLALALYQFVRILVEHYGISKQGRSEKGQAYGEPDNATRRNLLKLAGGNKDFGMEPRHRGYGGWCSGKFQNVLHLLAKAVPDNQCSPLPIFDWLGRLSRPSTQPGQKSDTTMGKILDCDTSILEDVSSPTSRGHRVIVP